MELLLDTHAFLWINGLIAQALTEDMEVVTADPLFDAYPVSVLW